MTFCTVLLNLLPIGKGGGAADVDLTADVDTACAPDVDAAWAPDTAWPPDVDAACAPDVDTAWAPDVDAAGAADTGESAAKEPHEPVSACMAATLNSETCNFVTGFVITTTSWFA